MAQPKILVTGAGGQLGSVLVPALQAKYGFNQVVASDIRDKIEINADYVQLDVLDKRQVIDIIHARGINQVYHLAAILSAKGEENVQFTWDINVGGLINLLEVARTARLEKVFVPSSIAVFGPLTQGEQTPQYPVLIPETIYGISKVTGEQWCNYYHKRFNLDVRSLRYPGLISYQSMPGGGTTDYAVDIFHKAVQDQHFQCFLSENTRLPMMYMPDAVRATLELMEAPREQISVRTSYNLAAMNFTPKEIYQEIQKHLPQFTISYQPDFRQEIADSWTQSINDENARMDWKWKEEYNLPKMVADMIHHLKIHYQEKNQDHV